MITNSKKWSPEALNDVATYDFSLETVYSNNGKPLAVKNCQWCGQRIVYVAVVKGASKSALGTDVERHIGCDCLAHLLGTSWRYYGTMNRQVKTLKDAASVESRRVKYETQYAKEIVWLQSLCFYLPGGSSMTTTGYAGKFLSDMLIILTTGNKQYSPKMNAYLQKLMEDKRFQPATVTKMTALQNTELTKIQTLLKLIEEVDGGMIHTQKSSYDLVFSVMGYVTKMNGATRKQLDMLNKIFARYTAMKKKKTEVKTTMNLNDPNIPF